MRRFTVAFNAVGRESLQHHFGIGVSPKFDAARFEFGAQLLEIVDLAVVSDDKAAIGGNHRLMAGRREIDNRQTPMGQCDARFSIAPDPLIIRTAIGEAVRHRHCVPLELIARTRQVENACNAAHRLVQEPDLLRIVDY